MTTRDRLVLSGIAIIVVLAGGWMLLVKPEQNKANSLSAQVAVAESQLASARSQLSQAREAQASYEQAYAAIVRMGKAVPAGKEVPSLVYELDTASNSRHVAFEAISSANSSSSASSTAAAAATAGFTQLPFTFTFAGSFTDLSDLLRRLDNFATSTSSGGLIVDGRLLTIQSIDLVPQTNSSPQGKSSSSQLTGTITATAYVLPVGEGLTGGANSSGPAGSLAQPVSSSGSSSPVTSPALVEAHP